MNLVTCSAEQRKLRLAAKPAEYPERPDVHVLSKLHHVHCDATRKKSGFETRMAQALVCEALYVGSEAVKENPETRGREPKPLRV